MSTSLPKVLIYSDGACSGNPGPGGWGAVLMSGTHRKEISGGEALTTNNRMELLAAISALEALKKRSNVELWTDSAYVRNGITGWIHGVEKKRLADGRQEAREKRRALARTRPSSRKASGHVALA